jgi:large subunit ribosomal protein L21
MYAVVNTGGKQYRVRQGEIFRVEKLPGEVGAPITFDRVLMLSDGETVTVGQPVVEDAAVEGRIVEQDRAKKILVFKYKRRKRYRRKQGHRQPYTAVRVDRITGPGIAAEAAPAEADELIQKSAEADELIQKPAEADELMEKPVEPAAPEAAESSIESRETE